MNVWNGGMIVRGGGKPEYLEKGLFQGHRPPQMARGLAWFQTQVSSVRGW